MLVGAPDNPPRALAAALRERLGLTVTPRVLRAPGERHSVLFGSLLDQQRALSHVAGQGHVSLLGRPVQLVPAGGAAEPEGEEQALRIFVSGDRSQVGKSTVCLGLLGALLEQGHRPSDIAYIKPATQCETPQLVGRFCAARGIANCPIGPIVFYSGFTRAFLAGETASAGEMLSEVRQACDELGRGRKVLVIDGVGYPAVGSITRTSNATVARALGAPVLLVGKKGVGDAVDTYCLNRSLFALEGVPVLGAVFNRLVDDDSYYSLAKCRAAVGQWFEQAAQGQRAYGFLPQQQALPGAAETAGAAAPVDQAAAAAAAAEAGRAAAAAGLSAEEERWVGGWVSCFAQRVDVPGILRDARAASQASTLRTSRYFSSPAAGGGERPGGGGQKRQRSEDGASAAGAGASQAKRGRAAIESQASAAGAAGG